MTKAEVFILALLAILIANEFVDPYTGQWILSILFVPVFLYALFVSPHVKWAKPLKSKSNGIKDSKVRSHKSTTSGEDNK